MIVAIHQPNFLPWLGYFEKMRQADLFVYLDHVPFSKGSYTNRVSIKTPSGVKWLTVPVKTAGKLGQLISEVVIQDPVSSSKRIDNSLTNAYQKAPNFVYCMERLREVLGVAYDSLVLLNVRLIDVIRDLFQIYTPILFASSLGVGGSSSDLLIDICKKVRAKCYLYGSGGLSYQDNEKFHDAEIELQEYSFGHPQYAQLHDDFVAGLSAVDYLFCPSELEGSVK